MSSDTYLSNKFLGSSPVVDKVRLGIPNFSLPEELASTQKFSASEKSFRLVTSTENAEKWFPTPLAKEKPLARCKSAGKCNGKEFWTGSWPSKFELPEDQRRDTACPYTFKNDSRKRIKRWPDLIGIGTPKCGTGPS